MLTKELVSKLEVSSVELTVGLLDELTAQLSPKFRFPEVDSSVKQVNATLSIFSHVHITILFLCS